MNEMTITALLWGHEGEYMVPIHSEFNPETDGEEEQRIIDRRRPSLRAANVSSAMKDLILGACLCNSSVKQSVSADGTDNPAVEASTEDLLSSQNTRLVGDAADVALYNLCQEKCSVDIEQVRKVNPRINIVPFNSKNKFMITANILEATFNNGSEDETVLVTLKGAPDFVLSRCTTYKQDYDEEDLPMTDEFRSSIQQRQEELGKSGYRVIAMLQQRMSKSRYDECLQAYKLSKTQQPQSISDEPDLNGLPAHGYAFVGKRNLSFCQLDKGCVSGMFSLLDPARPEVPTAVLKARRAQIRVAMVTGDHPTTAAAIAKKVNILSKEISIDGGLDTFKIEENNPSGLPLVHFMRNTHTLLESHVVSESKPLIDVKGIKLINTAQEKKNIFKRMWTRVRFYIIDPNQVKEVDKLELIPYGVVVAGGDMHAMDVSDQTARTSRKCVDCLARFSRTTRGTGCCLTGRSSSLERRRNRSYVL